MRLCKRVLGGCHNCRTGPLQMTSFTKSYFTRGYKGHTTFRALHPLQGTTAALRVLILLLTEKWPLANRVSTFGVCNERHCQATTTFACGRCRHFKRKCICMYIKRFKVRAVRVMHTVGTNPLELKVLHTFPLAGSQCAAA